MKKWTIPLVLMLLAAVPAHAAGFIDKADLPRSLDFLPPPPDENSIEFGRDKELYHETRKLKDSALWRQAAFDADIRANWQSFFLDAFGLTITREDTPATYELLSGAFADFSASLRSAKDHYQRARPYMYYQQPESTCLPRDERLLGNDGSYPSGHAAFGWGMALILSEISPERQGAILKRGYEFGYSRVVCGYHWASDVEMGRYVAAADVVQMHNNPEFNALMEKAGAEIAAVRRKTDH
jgi:acid phosphatase (class A)